MTLTEVLAVLEARGCKIDKSVSMEDVYEKYTVIERRGDIWVLEDKEK